MASSLVRYLTRNQLTWQPVVAVLVSVNWNQTKKKGYRQVIFRKYFHIHVNTFSKEHRLALMSIAYQLSADLTKKTKKRKQSTMYVYENYDNYSKTLVWDPCLKSPGTFLGPENHSKISNLTITELFYHIYSWCEQRFPSIIQEVLAHKLLRFQIQMN